MNSCVSPRPDASSTAWRKPQGARRKGCHRRSSSDQLIALNRVVGEVIWPNNEHTPHGFAVSLGLQCSSSLHSSFSQLSPPGRCPPSTLCVCYPALFFLHRILCNTYSLVYHLLPKTSNTCLFCSLLNLEQCLLHILVDTQDMVDK